MMPFSQLRTKEFHSPSRRWGTLLVLGLFLALGVTQTAGANSLQSNILYRIDYAPQAVQGALEPGGIYIFNFTGKVAKELSPKFENQMLAIDLPGVSLQEDPLITTYPDGPVKLLTVTKVSKSPLVARATFLMRTECKHRMTFGQNCLLLTLEKPAEKANPSRPPAPVLARSAKEGVNPLPKSRANALIQRRPPTLLVRSDPRPLAAPVQGKREFPGQVSRVSAQPLQPPALPVARAKQAAPVMARGASSPQEEHWRGHWSFNIPDPMPAKEMPPEKFLANLSPTAAYIENLNSTNVGVLMEARPTVITAEEISLDLNLDFNRLGSFVEGRPWVNKRKVTTHVRFKRNESVVIGGGMRRKDALISPPPSGTGVYRIPAGGEWDGWNSAVDAEKEAELAIFHVPLPVKTGKKAASAAGHASPTDFLMEEWKARNVGFICAVTPVVQPNHAVALQVNLELNQPEWQGGKTRPWRKFQTLVSLKNLDSLIVGGKGATKAGADNELVMFQIPKIRSIEGSSDSPATKTSPVLVGAVHGK